MARPSRPPVYPRKPHASGQARIKLANGKHVYLGPWGSPESYAAHKRLVAAWEPMRPSAGPATVAEVVTQFLDHAARTMVAKSGKPKPDVWHFRRLAGIVAATCGQLPAADFRAKTLRQVRDAMTRAGWCRRHINRCVVKVRRIFRWAESEELVPDGTWHHLRTVRALELGQATESGAVPEDWGDVPPVPEADLAATIPQLGRIPRAMVELQLLTGARPGEIMALRAADIDRAGQVWVAKLEQHKTAWRGHQRQLLFGPRAQALLRPFLARDGFLFSPQEAALESLAARKRKDGAPVSLRLGVGTRRPGERYTIRSYNWAIERACKRAGVPKWHPHHVFVPYCNREFP